MNKQITERIVAVLLVLFLLAYVFYQAQRFFYRPVSTETLYEYSVSRSIQATGIAVRDEAPLERAATGGEFYPHDDASRVALGETVAELSRDRSGDGATKRAKELEEEILLLREAQNTPVDYAVTELYNREIKTGLGRVSAMASEGRFSDLEETRKSLTLGINKKLISNGKARDFQGRIETLQEELLGIQSAAVSTPGSEVTAPVPGYFSRTVDGYELLATPEKLSGMGVADYERLLDGGAAPPRPARVGKMVYSEKWTFAAVIPTYETEWINELIKSSFDNSMRPPAVELQLDQAGQSVTAMLTGVVEEKESENAVLLFSCDTMNEELINLRVSGATINFQQFTGIRVNASDLRFRPNGEGVNERGVYVLDDHIVRFKLVDPIYEESGFLLSKTYYVDSETGNYVRLFDQVITKGMDLYDGKTIHDY